MKEATGPAATFVYTPARQKGTEAQCDGMPRDPPARAASAARRTWHVGQRAAHAKGNDAVLHVLALRAAQHQQRAACTAPQGGMLLKWLPCQGGLG